MAAYWPYILPQTATLGITKTKRMNTFIVHADGKISKALVAIFKALDVPFEIKKEKREEESPYDPEFVKKILERAENAKKGNVVEYTPELKKQWFGK